MKLKVMNMAGKSAGTIEVSDAVFGCEYNEALIHQVVVAQLANKRQGTMSALTRSEVRGGGAKPYRQKGTGRARQGSIVSPQFTGGGVVFAKKPRDFSQKINKNMKKAAFYSALSEKIRQEQVVVLDKFALAEPKTKLVAEAVDALKLSGKTLFVVEEYDEAAVRASKNIPTVSLEEVRLLSVYDIVEDRGGSTMTAYDIIISPVLSEKSYDGIPEKRYTFKVAKNANKTQIKAAVEEIFGVKVAKVNTSNYDGKLKRMGRNEGRRSSFKKAVVTLSADSKAIEFFESLA